VTDDATPAPHAHRHGLSTQAFESLYAASMLFGRDRLARAVACLAGVAPGDVVADVGCGPGTAVRRARRAGAAQAIGVDPSAQMVRLARRVTLRRTDAVTFLQGTAESLPLDSASATVVWAVQSLHHWEDPERGLRECRRVLAPGGRLVLFERAVVPGARGHAAHGLDEDRVAEESQLLDQIGFVDVAQRTVPLGRRTFVALTARAPAT
jgi:ubiquinone/menaquinone biosynthesis C-methylase UbiE